MNQSAHFLPGRGKRSGSQRIGVIHLVEPVNGDNFNAALCGKKPSGISLGWSETSGKVTCDKCIDKWMETNK